MLRQSSHSSGSGFTIIELMIATTVFSVILLVCAAALIQVGRIYQKGVITNQTQEVARMALGSIAESIQFSSGDVRTITPNGDGTNGFCIDNKRYSYLPNKKLVDDFTPTIDQTNHALVVDQVSGCSDTTPVQKLSNPTTLTTSSNELLSPNMQVLRLSVCSPGPIDVECPNRPPPNSNLYLVILTIAYGDNDLLTGDVCASSNLGGSFCSVSRLTTTVQRRIVK